MAEVVDIDERMLLGIAGPEGDASTALGSVESRNQAEHLPAEDGAEVVLEQLPARRR